MSYMKISHVENYLVLIDKFSLTNNLTVSFMILYQTRYNAVSYTHLDVYKRQVITIEYMVHWHSAMLGPSSSWQ